MKNQNQTDLRPTDLERMHYLDEGGTKRIETIKAGKTATLLGGEVLTYVKYTRDGEPMNHVGIISVEMISKRVPLFQNIKYATLEVAKS